MIQTQIVDGRVWHYSDIKMQIIQEETGLLYHDAVDVIPCRYTYQETNIPIPAPDAPPDLENCAEYLLYDGSVQLPEVTEPDYFNENEPEPDYFA